MKQIDDLFLNAHYSDLSPSEQSLIEDLCSDEVSFQQIKSLLSQSVGALPVNPPAHILDSLNQTFDQTYLEPEVQKRHPRMFSLFIASAAAASVLIFLSIYYFGFDNTPEKKLVKVERKQSPKKKKAPNIAPHPNNNQNPQLATVEPIAPIDYANNSTVSRSEQVMDEPAAIASIEMEDAKLESLRGSRSDEGAPTSNTYKWTTPDKNLKEVDAVVIAASSGYSSPKGKRANVETKRINTALMLKQIKPVY